MTRALAKVRSLKLWQQLGIFFVIAVPVALLAATTHHTETPQAAAPIAAPLPIATTTVTAPNAFMGLRLAGESAIVYDLSNGQTLYSQNADRQLPLASLTKLLSVYAGLQSLTLTTSITISSTSLAAEGDYGLTEGESFTFGSLAKFTLVASANDAAEAIAEAVETARGMDARTMLAGAAAAAGLSKTYAVNGSGLDVSTTQSGGYGSARDVAILAGKVLQKAPAIAEATTQPSITVRSLEGTVHSLPNTNQEVTHVPGILLSKTGYTDLAGGNLVVVFDAAIGHPVAVVVLGSTRDGRFADVDRLMQATRDYFAGLAKH